MMSTRFSSLQMECRLFFVSKRSPFRFEPGADAVQVKIVASIVQSCLFTIDIPKVGAGLRFLVEGGAVRT